MTGRGGQQGQGDTSTTAPPISKQAPQTASKVVGAPQKHPPAPNGPKQAQGQTGAPSAAATANQPTPLTPSVSLAAPVNQRPTGFFSAIGDFFGFDGDFGYDGPTHDNLSLGNFGEAVLDLTGKVWNLPNTAIGLAWGSAGMLVDWAAYAVGWRDNLASIDFGENAIQFINNPFAFAGAITLGNVQVYGDAGFDRNGQPRDMRNVIMTPPGQPIVTMRQHEEPHTCQGQQLGPLYLPSNILGGLTALALDGAWHGPHNWNERGPQMNPPRRW